MENSIFFFLQKINNNNNECCCAVRRRLLNCVMVYTTDFLADRLGARVYILDLDIHEWRFEMKVD